MTTRVPDDVFEAGLRALHGASADTPSLELLLGMDAPIAGLRAALAVAYAAGQRASEGDKFQWGSRRDGYKTVRVTSEDGARSDARTQRGGGVEVLRRRLGPWELVEYVPPRVREVTR